MLKQILAVTAMNLKSLKGRFWPSLVIVIGMACVVGVLLSMMSFTVGVVNSITGTGDPGLALVLSVGAENGFSSDLPRSVLPIISNAPGIARDAAGKPLVDANINIDVPMTNKILNKDSSMSLSAVGPQGIALRSKFKLVEGRLFRPGARELIIGRAAQGQFAGTALGDKVTLPDGQWPIVGVFTSDYDATEGGFIADRDTVMTANRKSTYEVITARMASPAAFESFHRAVTTNPAIQVSAERQPVYIARSIGQFSDFLAGTAYLVSGVMAVGAIFGALNTMYAAVSSRSREIATLRALGFARVAVVISVLAEALFLALVGALIGAAIAWTSFNGNQKALDSLVFNLTVSPGLVVTGILWALAVGLIGGLFPAVRAARLPVAHALRAT